MLDVVGLGRHFHRPRIGPRVLRWPEDQDAGARAIPIRPFRSLAVQRRDNQFLLAIAIDIGPSDSVKRGFRGDRKDFPGRSGAGRILPDPLQGAGVLAHPPAPSAMSRRPSWSMS